MNYFRDSKWMSIMVQVGTQYWTTAKNSKEARRACIQKLTCTCRTSFTSLVLHEYILVILCHHTLHR